MVETAVTIIILHHKNGCYCNQDIQWWKLIFTNIEK